MWCERRWIASRVFHLKGRVSKSANEVIVPIGLGEMSVQLKSSANPFGPWGLFVSNFTALASKGSWSMTWPSGCHSKISSK